MLVLIVFGAVLLMYYLYTVIGLIHIFKWLLFLYFPLINFMFLSFLLVFVSFKYLFLF